MTAPNSEPIKNRYDITYLFDVTDGNPNGDPDAGNLPRTDPETGQGIVTDVCLKRKIRNFVGLLHGEQPPYEIYVKERAVLNRLHERAWDTHLPDVKRADRKKLPKKDEDAHRLTAFMCKNFFDIRAFGAVMTTEVNCGQVRGPIQFGFARSIDPITTQEYAITRCAVTNERDLEKERTIGRKFAVPYGLYRVHAYVNPNLANPDRHGTGFSEEDLTLFRKALCEMFEHDRSAARGEMRPRACLAFRHESALGNARADELFERVRVQLRPEFRAEDRPARNFADYEVAVDEAGLPDGVTLERWL